VRGFALLRSYTLQGGVEVARDGKRVRTRIRLTLIEGDRVSLIGFARAYENVFRRIRVSPAVREAFILDYVAVLERHVQQLTPYNILASTREQAENPDLVSVTVQRRVERCSRIVGKLQRRGQAMAPLGPDGACADNLRLVDEVPPRDKARLRHYLYSIAAPNSAEPGS